MKNNAKKKLNEVKRNKYRKKRGEQKKESKSDELKAF